MLMERRPERGKLLTKIKSKLDFNVHAVSACICKQCHVLEKLDHVPMNLQVLTDFFER